VSSSEPRGRQSAEFESHEASGLPQKHKLPTLYNGEPTIPQVHYKHDDIDVSARSTIRWEGVLRVLLPPRPLLRLLINLRVRLRIQGTGERNLPMAKVQRHCKILQKRAADP